MHYMNKIMTRISMCLMLWGACLWVSMACGPYDRMYLASEYCMFRACASDMKGEAADMADDGTEENCRLWARLTSPDIPTEDIRQVVYKWTVDQMDELCKATAGQSPLSGSDNRFAAWIVEHRDTETAAFLLLAKQNEKVRLSTRNPWYYATEGDEETEALHDIADRARSYRGQRLRDRYALQIIRALFSFRRWEECINVWNEYQKSFGRDVIRLMAQGYVAGAYRRIGQTDKAREFTEPETRRMSVARLQQRIHRQETHETRWWPEDDSVRRQEYAGLYDEVQRVVAGRQQGDNMAAWYYAGAFLSDKLGRRDEAVQWIGKARRTRCDSDLKDAVRVLHIYLTVKYAPAYNTELENRLLPELLWLDGVITARLDSSARTRIECDGFENHNQGRSQYYWNDMMRKIVIGELVPLCIRSNYKTRALQYLNMADNGIFTRVTRVSLSYRWEWDGDGGWNILPDSIVPVADYRSKVDYSNDYFINLDSMGVEYVQRLAYRYEHPLCALDRFLQRRGYTDPQYLCDIIGTQLIAAMRYGEAVPYLQRVSPAFNRSRNVFPYCDSDPFTGRMLSRPDPLYKLHFAREMSRLQHVIRTAADPNDRAESMLRYAYGLQHSVGSKGWPLTSYYYGYFECYPFYSTRVRTRIFGIREEYERAKAKAFASFTDSERAARAYYDWKMFRTAVLRCGDTETARLIRTRCDNLRDYDLRLAPPPALEPGE